MKTATRNLALSLCVTLLALAAVAAEGDAGPFLSEPSDATPLETALGYLDQHQGDLGLSLGDLADLVVQDQYVTHHNGVTHVVLRQRLGGVEVVNGDIGVHVMPDGRIVHLTSRFVSDLASKVNTRAPQIQPEEAVARAAEHLGLELDSAPVLLEVVGGPAMEVRFAGDGISRDDIPVKLMYLPLPDGTVRLVWSQVIRQINSSDWWHLFADAVTDRVLEKFNWTVSESFAATGASDAASASSQPKDAILANSKSEGGDCVSDCYNVFALPKESPLNGPRTIEDNPADTTASPFRWHDTNGAPGGEFTDTRGNNVEAQTDINGNNVFGPPDIRPDGGINLIFDFPLDPNLPPDTYREAAVANLFYYNNIMHDVTFRYGFDSPAGNFQNNTYGLGGVGGDPLQADAQDNSEPVTGAPSCNNANFGTPPDGVDPRMQMFIWTGIPNARVTVNSGPAAGDYDAAKGCWGGPLDPPTTADVEQVEDGTGTNEGCNALIGFTPGNVALIDRGSCEFGSKALNAENAGASGAIIVNNDQLPNDIISMGAGAQGGSVTIPAVMIGSADGTTIRTELPGVNATIQAPLPGGNVDRDSDLDNGIIGHEYGHGISNRLVGGPSNVGCLAGAEQMGEGLSDWWTLVLSALPGHTPDLPRGIGNYVIFEGINGPGIRNFPYSTNMAVNPQTYADIDGTNVPHGVGEIWNAMAWEVYWLLVLRDGFDPDLYTGTGGNNLAIQLMVDGMKMAPCGPTFVDLRDAILAADVASNGGANACEIWTGFAKRGLGFSAVAGTTAVGDEIEAFDVPSGLENCTASIFVDGFESGDVSAWSGSVP